MPSVVRETGREHPSPRPEQEAGPALRRGSDSRAASQQQPIDPRRLSAFWAILALALLFGGASKVDSLTQPIVRLGGIAILAWVMISGRSHGWRNWPTPFRLLALLGAWMAVQLVPLPSPLWRLQPGMTPYATALDVIGLGGEWHPLSLSPDLTLNSVFALLPLFVLAATAAGLRARELASGLPIVLAAAALGALIEVGQLAGALPSFHGFSTPGWEAGLFANRNHHAAMLCCALALLGAWAAGAPRRSPRPWIALGCGLLVLPLVLANGSRAGLIAAPLAALLGAAIAMSGRSRRLGRPFWLGTAGVAMAVVALSAAVLLLGRDRSVGRLLASGDGPDLRFRVWDTLGHMVQDFVWTGAGFGTFNPVFRGYEPQWALKPTFFNHAHNDLIEIVIEGGLPALALLAILLVWIVRRSISAWRDKEALPRAASVVLIILLAWSLFDYPLRTPALAVLAGWCALVLACPGSDDLAHRRIDRLGKRSGIG